MDGLSSTALLVEFFRLVGKEPRVHVPRGREDGYGLRRETVERLAAEGTRLIVTVDNGSSAVEAAARAAELGIDVVITDHHQAAPVLPPAHAHVNPWLPGSRYPFPHLAGVGVAFKLVWAIAQRFSRSKKLSPELREFLLGALAFAALGTISDVVPLLGENRVLASHGLPALERSTRPGLRALVEFARRGEREPLTAERVAFRIAPALNAAGRMGDSGEGLRLLLAATDEEARALVQSLDRANRRRQEVEEGLHRQASEMVRAELDLPSTRGIVLARAGWHPGVIGIVASRIAEEFHRPTLLIALDGERGKGSGRSVAGVHLCEALGRCRELLVNYGGHAFAAGLEVESARVDALRRAFDAAIPLAPEELVPEVSLDAELRLEDISERLLHDLRRLEPHGEGNRKPVFLGAGLEVAGVPRFLGQEGRHLSFLVRPGSAVGEAAAAGSLPRVLRALAFGRADLAGSVLGGERGSRRPLGPAPAPIDLAFEPFLNRFRGEEQIELNVKAMRRAAARGPDAGLS